MDFHASPVRIDLDPQFDVFRRLDSREIPSALSQGFWCRKTITDSAARADKQILDAYRALAANCRKPIEPTGSDYGRSNSPPLPADPHHLIMGWQNKFAEAVAKTLADRGVSYQQKKKNCNWSKRPIRKRSTPSY